MYGIEGTDQTWDDPAGFLATLERIAKAAESSDELGPHIPEGGLINALQTVIDRLEKHPETERFIVPRKLERLRVRRTTWDIVNEACARGRTEWPFSD